MLSLVKFEGHTVQDWAKLIQKKLAICDNGTLSRMEFWQLIIEHAMNIWSRDEGGGDIHVDVVEWGDRTVQE